jgi:hypothetical protein
MNFLHMASRAYHDSLFMARIAPVAMLFILAATDIATVPTSLLLLMTWPVALLSSLRPWARYLLEVLVSKSCSLEFYRLLSNVLLSGVSAITIGLSSAVCFVHSRMAVLADSNQVFFSVLA